MQEQQRNDLNMHERKRAVCGQRVGGNSESASFG
jgi:hypothetical protein